MDIYSIATFFSIAFVRKVYFCLLKLSPNPRMKNKIEFKFGILALLVLIVALARLIPNMPNFSPMTAIAVFGAVHFEKMWKAILVTILAAFISDLVLNNTLYASMFDGFTFFYDGFVWQYMAYAMISLVSVQLFTSISTAKVVGGSIAATLIFFLVSNFGAWISLPFYSKDLTGLFASYTAGLPFLKMSFLIDMFYSILLFGGYYLLQSRFQLFRWPYLKYS